MKMNKAFLVLGGVVLGGILGGAINPNFGVILGAIVGGLIVWYSF